MSHQNYAAALRILKFVERVSPDHPDLFDRAILSTDKRHHSTLHLLLGSISSTFDLRTMTLYVHNLQLSTAKQLLRLFQVRYPSAYKAEIVKRGAADGVGSGVESGGSSADEEDEDSNSDQEEGDGLMSLARGDYLSGRARRPFHSIRECE